uniref:Uncharacterized protein n=1 Tax=Anguilla anguilla TaxID=7936 RepID=A0A0E9T4U2_ANGAN
MLVSCLQLPAALQSRQCQHFGRRWTIGSAYRSRMVWRNTTGPYSL